MTDSKKARVSNATVINVGVSTSRVKYCLNNLGLNKKFNEERKSRQLAEEKSLDWDKQLKLISSDNKYLKEDLIKKEKEFNDEIQKYLNLKREFEHELLKRNQDIASLNSEVSNFKIKEKHDHNC